MYRIRGRHSTVYPVQLPNWSCPDVVKELITRFNRYLKDELITMWEKHLEMEGKKQLSQLFQDGRKIGHAHHPSLQSVSSAITDSSVLSSGTNLNDLERLKMHVPEADGRENFKLE